VGDELESAEPADEEAENVVGVIGALRLLFSSIKSQTNQSSSRVILKASVVVKILSSPTLGLTG